MRDPTDRISAQLDATDDPTLRIPCERQAGDARETGPVQQGHYVHSLIRSWFFRIGPARLPPLNRGSATPRQPSDAFLARPPPDGRDPRAPRTGNGLLLRRYL